MEHQLTKAAAYCINKHQHQHLLAVNSLTGTRTRCADGRGCGWFFFFFEPSCGWLSDSPFRRPPWPSHRIPSPRPHAPDVDEPTDTDRRFLRRPARCRCQRWQMDTTPSPQRNDPASSSASRSSSIACLACAVS
jgi:hypothetical protein